MGKKAERKNRRRRLSTSSNQHLLDSEGPAALRRGRERSCADIKLAPGTATPPEKPARPENPGNRSSLETRISRHGSAVFRARSDKPGSVRRSLPSLWTQLLTEGSTEEMRRRALGPRTSNKTGHKKLRKELSMRLAWQAVSPPGLIPMFAGGLRECLKLRDAQKRTNEQRFAAGTGRCACSAPASSSTIKCGVQGDPRQGCPRLRTLGQMHYS